MSLTPKMMYYAGSSGMIGTSSPIPNGQQNYNLCVPANTENLPGEYLLWKWPKAVKQAGNPRYSLPTSTRALKSVDVQG